MRRTMSALAVALVLTGCGGTDWNSATAGTSGSTAKTAKAAKSAKASKAARLAQATAAAKRAYIDALVASGAANDSGVNAVTVRCTASAIVGGYGVTAFENAGITAAELRDPDSTLQSLPAPSAAQITAVGTAVQKCGLGTPAAQGLADGLGTDDPAAIGCMANRLDTDPAARRFLVFILVHRPVDLLAAHAAVGVIAACIDLPSLIIESMNVQVDTTTRACLVDTLKLSEAKLKDYVAILVVNGNQAEASVELRDSLAVDINRCRPSARTGFTVPDASG
jgi:hypothetical protein